MSNRSLKMNKSGENKCLLEEERSNIFIRLTEINDFFNSTKVSKGSSAITVKHKRFLSLCNDYKNLESKIISYNLHVKDEDDKIEYQQQASAIFNLCDNIEQMYLDLSNDVESTSVSNVQASALKPLLPRIQVPTFSGNFKDWNAFISLFNSVVHNQPITNIEKFQYLRSFLSSDALKLIDHFQITDSNYLLAYDSLCSRYDNPRVSANTYINDLLNFKASGSNPYVSLQKYLNVHLDAVKAYEHVNIPNHHDYLLFQICYSHLDKSMQNLFDVKFPVNHIPKYDDLMEFIQLQLRTAEMHSETGTSRKQVKSLFTSTHSKSRIDEKPKCILCQSFHKLHACPIFNQMSISDRYETLKKFSVCFNCFGSHLRNKCNSKYKCKLCQKPHHTMLHVADSVDSKDKPSKPVSLSCGLNDSFARKTVLLGTATALLLCSNGSYKPIRLVLDSASQVSCITQRCVKMSGLQIKPSNVQISGICNTNSSSLGLSECTLKPTRGGRNLKFKAVVLNEITSQVPTSVHFSHKFSKYHLADQTPDDNIDLLLGADLFVNVLLSKPLIRGKPSGLHTIFGLVLIGEIPMVASSSNNVHSLFTTAQSLDESLSKFWQIEEVSEKHQENPEDIMCEQLFQATTTRDVNGRYVVQLPHSSITSDGTNREIALKRFYNLERRLINNSKLQVEYSNFMKEYLDSGHMSPAQQSASYVIPHSSVFKDSSTTRLRVVFDASCKDSKGISLNDRLLRGPVLLKDISFVLSGFRLYPVALCADIKAMYRQILVSPEHRANQHIFWRFSPQEPVTEYELNTVTYGLKPSSFLAQRTIHQLVQDEGSAYPLASDVLLNHTFVDDIVAGADCEDQANMLFHQLNELLMKGGFVLRKWSSSSPNLLLNVPSEHKETPRCIDNTNDLAYKVLGMQWNASSDSFTYLIVPFTGAVTKRSVLSYIARMFDVCGWLTPFIFQSKHIMQLLHLAGVGYDDELPSHLTQVWLSHVSNVNVLSSINIPRLIPVNKSDQIDVVGFCDASMKGYASVFYLRCIQTNSVSVHLLKAKSRVAPLKVISVPRLELCAALLLSRLYKSLMSFWEKLPSHNVYLFSDSKIVLSWLKIPSYKLKTFVSNRVAEIVETVPPHLWHYVPSENNPADCASRGLDPNQLLDHEMWFNGPQFLYESNLNLPQVEILDDTNVELLELRPKQVLSSSVSFNDLVDEMEKFSSFHRLKRVFALVLRFINRCQRKKGNLSRVEELENSLNVCVRLVQQKYFISQIKLLKSNSYIPDLRALAPFLDDNGSVRVGGRLSKSDLPTDVKHPLLIPKCSHLAELICMHFHNISLHAGPQGTRALIQTKYWIPGIGHLIKRCISQCVICYRLSAPVLQPPMADLPAARFDQIRPFINVAIDFAGYFNVKESSKRKSSLFKSYVCVFVCLSTKAIHLEMVSQLTSSAFLAALDRFVARRGLCSQIFSDNGTNFVAGNKELIDVCHFLKKSSCEIERYLATKQIRWKFNPAAAPHFTGLAEAAVKSFKHHLIRTIRNHTLTQEEFLTVICRIEAVLNSRPLCSLPSSPLDADQFLTPGHFIIGGPLLAVPELSVTHISLNRLSRWQLIIQCVQSFWKKWSSSYLQSLMQRYKWTKPSLPLKVGDIVILKKMNTPPLSWPLAKVICLFPDEKGIARVAKLQCSGAQFTRSVNSLIPLSLMWSN